MSWTESKDQGPSDKDKVPRTEIWKQKPRYEGTVSMAEFMDQRPTDKDKV